VGVVITLVDVARGVLDAVVDIVGVLHFSLSHSPPKLNIGNSCNNLPKS